MEKGARSRGGERRVASRGLVPSRHFPACAREHRGQMAVNRDRRGFGVLWHPALRLGVKASVWPRALASRPKPSLVLKSRARTACVG